MATLPSHLQPFVLAKLNLPVSDDTNRRVLAVLTYLRGRR